MATTKTTKTAAEKAARNYGKWGRAVPVRFGDDLRAKVDAFCEKHNLAASEIVRAALPVYFDAVKHDASLVPAKETKPARETKAAKPKAEKLAKPPKNEAKPLGTSKKKGEKKPDATAGLKFPKKPAKTPAPATPASDAVATL